MKKALLSLVLIATLMSASAKTAAKYTVYDDCGQVLTFTVSCSSCSVQDLAVAAQNYINSRTGSDGCFH